MSETDNAILRSEPTFGSSGHPRRAFPRPVFTPSADYLQGILPEDIFLGLLCLERKRAERSSKKFLLLLLDAEDARVIGRHAEIMSCVIKAVDGARRNTDPAGWYKSNSILGIVFTELGAMDDTATIQRLLDRIQETLLAHLSPDEAKYVDISAHIFADKSSQDGFKTLANPALYPDLV